MNVQGLQKLTLLDFPGNVACTLFTGGCNLRCPFCHNSGLIGPGAEGEWNDLRVISFLNSRKGILDGVCVSGGEPLLQPDLPAFLSRIKELGFAIKLDTNGCFPEKLRNLVEQHLVDYVAMDVKNSPQRYAETVGVSGFDLTPVRESVSFLLEGTVPYEFRTTVVREFHTEGEIESLSRWIEGAERYYLQSFVDSGAVLSPGLSAWDADTMFRMQSIARTYVPNTEVRGI